MAIYLGSEMVNAFSGIPQSLNGENKTAITTALTNKGVTVPDDMDINDIATLIEAIETGGGAKFASGTFIPASDTILGLPYKIEHNSGFVPDVFMVLYFGSFSSYGLRQAVSFPTYFLDGDKTDLTYQAFGSGWGSNVNSRICEALAGIPSSRPFTENYAYIRSESANLNVKSGLEYHWYAIGGLQ